MSKLDIQCTQSVPMWTGWAHFCFCASKVVFYVLINLCGSATVQCEGERPYGGAYIDIGDAPHPLETTWLS